jgi:fatty acid desaturase
MKLFRHTPLDLLLISYVAIAFASPFVIASFASTTVWFLLIPLQAIFLVIVMNTSLHHHMHTPIFTNDKLNKVYEIFVSAVLGIPFSGWKFFHVVHHKHNNDFKIDGKTKDPLSFYRYGENGKRENFWSYCIKGLWRDLSGQTVKDPLNNCSTKVYIKDKISLRVEQFAFYVFLASVFAFNIGYGFVYLIVHILSLILNNANSYGEHFGPVEQQNFRANSVGSYSKIYNLLCFNSGYHQEHHVRPGAHWTYLPKITKTLPIKRHTINKMYMFNAPWFKDLINK